MQMYTLPAWWRANNEVVVFKVEAVNVGMAITLARADAQEIWESAGQTGPAEISFVGVFLGDCERVDFHTFLEDFT